MITRIGIGGVVATAGLATVSFAGPDTQAQQPVHATAQPTVPGAALPLHNRPPGTTFKRTELYFGSAKANGGQPVTDEQFDLFVDKVVTPRFPDGLTQLTGEGQFNGSTGPIEEKSFLVILLYPVDDRQANREIEEIRTAYKKQFEQESVLRADSQDRVSF